MCCSTQIRLSFATGVGAGGVSSTRPDDDPAAAAAAAGWEDSNPGTSGSSDSLRPPSPDATLGPAPRWFTALDALGEVTETCVEHARSLSKCEASESGTEPGCGSLSLLPLRPLTHVAVDPTFELRAVRLERVVREALFHAAILLGR